MLRTVLATVAGVVVGAVLVALFDQLGNLIHPLPPGVDLGDKEALAAHIHAAPAAAMLAVLAGWAVGSLGGAWVAAKIAVRHRLGAALAVGALLLVAGIANLMMIPHPLWFGVVGVLVFLPAAWLGARLAGAAGPGAPAAGAGG